MFWAIANSLELSLLHTHHTQTQRIFSLNNQSYQFLSSCLTLLSVFNGTWNFLMAHGPRAVGEDSRSKDTTEWLGTHPHSCLHGYFSCSWAQPFWEFLPNAQVVQHGLFTLTGWSSKYVRAHVGFGGVQVTASQWRFLPWYAFQPGLMESHLAHT